LIEPDNADAHTGLGLALTRMGNIEEAVTHFEQALKLQPGLTAASNALARLRTNQ
jgi:Flp pilus assembly protein TadD